MRLVYLNQPYPCFLLGLHAETYLNQIAAQLRRIIPEQHNGFYITTHPPCPEGFGGPAFDKFAKIGFLDSRKSDRDGSHRA